MRSEMVFVCAKCEGHVTSGSSLALRPGAMHHHFVCYPCHDRLISHRVKKGTATKSELNYFKEAMDGVHPVIPRKRKKAPQ